MTERQVVVLDPVGEVRVAGLSLAPGLSSIAGRRIGILFNNKQNRGAGLLTAIGESLLRHGAAEIVSLSKGSRARACEPEVLAELLARTDAVVSGVAD